MCTVYKLLSFDVIISKAVLYKSYHTESNGEQNKEERKPVQEDVRVRNMFVHNETSAFESLYHGHAVDKTNNWRSNTVYLETNSLIHL